MKLRELKKCNIWHEKLGTTKENINEIEDIAMEIIQTEAHKEKKNKQKWTKFQWPMEKYHKIWHSGSNKTREK